MSIHIALGLKLTLLKVVGRSKSQAGGFDSKTEPACEAGEFCLPGNFMEAIQRPEHLLIWSDFIYGNQQAVAH
ncbi:hypothetical protein [Spongorhabdus nitratireducens]